MRGSDSMDKGRERRNSKRLPIELHLSINHMFRQNYEELKGLDAKIDVYDISKSGIGFVSRDKLPKGYYFNAKIGLYKKEYFYAVVKIVRSIERESEECEYGAEFVGLAPFLADKIDSYEKNIEQRI